MVGEKNNLTNPIKYGMITMTPEERLFYAKTGLLVGAENLTVFLVSTEQSPFLLENIMKIKKICEVCNKIFYVKPRRKNTAKYCSYKCYGKNQRGKILSDETRKKMSESHQLEKHSNWKGGKTFTGRYIRIKKRDHPFSNMLGYVYEHRLIVEQYLGRYLDKKETVHHINSNPIDNRIENLMVFSTTGSHTRHEFGKKTSDKDITFNGSKLKEVQNVPS